MNYSIKFDLRKSKGKKCPIRCRVNIPSQRVELSVGLSVLPSEWDSTSQRCTKTCKGYLKNNKLLSDIYNAIDGYITQCFLKKEPIVAEDIKEVFNSVFTFRQSSRGDFVSVMDKFIHDKSIENSWSNKNIMKWNTLKNGIHEWRPKIGMNDFTENTMRAYMERIIEKGHHNTTILRSVQYLREFLSWAFEHGYYNQHAHVSFRPKLRGLNVKEVVYLELEELNMLMNYPCGNKVEQEIVDVFVFCCFTGLRYSDVSQLRREDIRGDKIHIVTKKTSDNIIIELNKHSRNILNKYNGILPVHASQYCNLVLKRVAKKCGINQQVRIVYYIGNERHDDMVPKYNLISNHCARRTFVVNALRLGVPAEVIMKWTGHKKYESMKPYTKIVEKLKEDNMKRFDSI